MVVQDFYDENPLHVLVRSRTRWTSEGEGMRVLRYRATGVMTCAERE
jgi:hypothetical protein